MSYECNHKHRLRSTAKQPKKNISYARRNKVWQNLQCIDMVYREIITREGKNPNHLQILVAIHKRLTTNQKIFTS